VIGHRLTVASDRFDYIIGVLVDEGLAGDVDFMPVGGAEIVITEDAWARLDAEPQQAIARFARSPASEAWAADVGDVQPADGDGSDGGSARTASSGRSTSTKATRGAR
jgi:hypothetical protein